LLNRLEFLASVWEVANTNLYRIKPLPEMKSRFYDNPAYILFTIMTELPVFLNKPHNCIFINL
jgi:hypothetical protein